MNEITTITLAIQGVAILLIAANSLRNTRRLNRAGPKFQTYVDREIAKLRSSLDDLNGDLSSLPSIRKERLVVAQQQGERALREIEFEIENGGRSYKGNEGKQIC